MTRADKLVVDASVAIKWYVPEVGSEEASAILQRDTTLLAPDLLVAELGNVIWKKVLRGELDPSEADEIIQSFVNSCPVDLRSSRLLVPAAVEVAVRLQHPVYDALYLTLAIAEDCPLVTADDRLRRALAGSPLEAFVRPLLVR